MNKFKAPKELISSVDFSAHKSETKEFENYEFRNCMFGDLSQLNFTECSFINCNISNAKTSNTRLQDCLFKDCKLLGLNFSGAKDFAFEVHFESCNMDYVSFDRRKLNKSSFKNCRLHNANFTQADLSKSTLANCDLYEALFSGSNLSGVDFTSSINFTIDPESNNIKKAKFTLQGLPGLLYRHNIIIE